MRKNKIWNVIAAITFTASLCIAHLGQVAFAQEINEESSGTDIIAETDGGVALNETNFPDPAFLDIIKRAFDLDQDDVLNDKELRNLTSISIYVSGNGMDFTGIRYFKNLQVFKVSGKNIKGLDLSECTDLKSVDISHSTLVDSDGLKLDGCTELIYFKATDSNLKSIDLSHCPKLIRVECDMTDDLERLDLSTNTKLEYIECGGANLTDLILGPHAELKEFHCSSAEQLTMALDFQNSSNLKEIDLFKTGIESLNLSGCTALEKVTVFQNDKVNQLNLTGCTALTDINCAYNYKLTELDVHNLTNLKKLECYNNSLNKLDLAGCTALETITCNNNKLESLNLSGLNLTKLICYDNQINSLNLGDLTALKEFSCAGNNIENLDLSKNTELVNLSCGDNNLSILDIRANTKLTGIYCYNNNLTKLDISANTKLESINCRHNQLDGLDVSKCTNLTTLNCSENKLDKLDVGNCTELTKLICSKNNLTSLNLTANIYLEELECNRNQLTGLNVRLCPYLVSLECSENKITILDISEVPFILSTYLNGKKYEEESRQYATYKGDLYTYYKGRDLYFQVDPGVGVITKVAEKSEPVKKDNLQTSTEDKAGNQAGDKATDKTGDKAEDKVQSSGKADQTGSSTVPVKVGDTKKDTASKVTYVITSTDANNLTVAYKACSDKNASTLTLPDTVKIDGKNYKVTEIRANAFKNNKKLKTITIGKNIQKIGKNAFYGCKKLKKITIKTTKLTKKKVGTNAFKGINAKAKIKVPKKQLKSYKKILKARGVKGKKQKITS